MKFSQLFGLLLASLAMMAGCKKAGGDNTAPEASVDLSMPTEAQPKLPTIKLWLGPEEMTAETAVTAQQERTGMMFRKSMGENHGMIFVLPSTDQARFWMTNCYIPLSVAYIDPEGVIQEIHDLQPHNIETVNSATNNIRFALETPQGWFQRHNIRAGMTIRTERGPLMETFHQSP
jgi:uncharacterized membrane protein (UPF0127 family)